MKIRVLSILAATVFCCFLLSACDSSTPASGTSQPDSSSSSISSSDSASASSSTDPANAPVSSSVGDATPVPGELTSETVLNGLLGFGPGTAGSSLKSVSSAVNLINWAASSGNLREEDLTSLVEGWYNDLSDDERENLTETWPMVNESACRLLEGEDLSNLMSDAGVSLDPATPDAEQYNRLASYIDKALQETPPPKCGVIDDTQQPVSPTPAA